MIYNIHYKIKLVNESLISKNYSDEESTHLALVFIWPFKDEHWFTTKENAENIKVLFLLI